MMKLVVSAVFVLLLSGCSTLKDMAKVEEVKPWQKGILAKPEMLLAGDPVDGYVDDHIYFSKEASTGGTGVGGGGCGCN